MSTESNRFAWPGPDLRAVDSETGYYGALPPTLFAEVKRRFVASARRSRRKRPAPQRAANELTARQSPGPLLPRRGGPGCEPSSLFNGQESLQGGFTSRGVTIVSPFAGARDDLLRDLIDDG